MTDAENQTTWFEYDRNNRLTKETRPMGEETSYTYWPTGELETKIDPKNQKTQYEYYDNGWLHFIRYYADAADVTPVKTVAFTYDKVGNLLTYDDGTTQGTYTYDDNYRKLSETVNYGSFSKSYSYTYYDNGMKETFTGPDGITYTYAYDESNKLARIGLPGDQSITYNKYKWNRPQDITLPGGGTKHFEYDPLMRVEQITSKDPGQNPILNYGYSYDKVDNIVGRTSTEQGDYTYNYDNLYRLTSVTNPTQGIDDEAFTYDNVGNRLTSADTTGSWSYNDNNELTGYQNSSFTYDDNGNMTQKVDGGITWNYVYNTEDRLSQASDGTTVATYYYDPFGRRLWKEVDGVRAYFHYADEGLIGEYDATGAEIKAYGWKPNSTWSTDPVFMKEDGNYYYYQNDHLGTPQKIVRSNGAVVWSAKYESFGGVDIDTNDLTNNIRFGGQYADAETGLNWNLWRYYDSGIGRYLRSDPIGLAGGIHLFDYVAGNPINLFDPLGLEIAYGNHPVALGLYHSKIVITPINQKRYENDPRFQNIDAYGRRYATIGAGRIKGMLIAGVNRERDKSLACGNKQVLSLPTFYNSEDDAIASLFEMLDNYNTNPERYSLIPRIGGEEYNSNSFIRGIMEAGGFDVPPNAGAPVPGYSNAVPAINYQDTGGSL